jgi:diguanylate cyclase (GGDEF)-like protein/hemerythrin-like metal-binding protein
MDSRTLAFAISLLGTALVFITAVLAAVRRERCLTILAAGLFADILGFTLLRLPFQYPVDHFAILGGNLLILFHHLSLAWSLRVRFAHSRPWPFRFWTYFAAWLGILLVWLFVVDSYPVRTVAASALFILAGAESLISFKRSPPGMPPVLRFAGTVAAAGSMLFYAIRILLIVAVSGSGRALMDNNAVSAYTFSGILLFLAVWTGLILIIDSSGLFLELQSQTALLDELATKDALTGLSNRHRLIKKVQAEIQRSLRYDEALSLVIFDIDHFKKVNDSWGHGVGDQVLVGMAEVARGLIREPDNLFRWGGEEFVVLAPHTDLRGAEALAEKLRRAIEERHFPTAGRITASFGVAQWHPGLEEEQWFRQADQALYRAKNAGRNCVVRFEERAAFPVAQVRLEWRSDWESGNPFIDEEHSRILDLSNRLIDLSLSEVPAAEIRSGVEDLLEHVAAHFTHEEQLLEEIGYPEAAEHARLHQDLVRDALALKDRVAQGECEPGPLFDFLVGKVVMAHMLHADVRFFPYFRKTKDAGSA